MVMWNQPLPIPVQSEVGDHKDDQQGHGKQGQDQSKVWFIRRLFFDLHRQFDAVILCGVSAQKPKTLDTTDTIEAESNLSETALRENRRPGLSPIL